MNTQTHILLAAALLTKPGRENRARNLSVLAGALVPDILIFVMFIWSKLIGAPERQVWETWYFNPPWQTAIDAANSMPIYLLILVFGIIWMKSSVASASTGVLVVVFALAAFSHLFGDIFLHVHDGHAHFWPFSEWRFVSPISYWNPQYFGNYVSLMEAIVTIFCAVILYRRFQLKWLHMVLLLSIAFYVAVPAYFIFVSNHH